jgi:hypothetical protein
MLILLLGIRRPGREPNKAQGTGLWTNRQASEDYAKEEEDHGLTPPSSPSSANIRSGSLQVDPLTANSIVYFVECLQL